MKNTLLKGSRRYLALLLALLTVLSLVLTGCSEELLKDLVSDFVRVTVRHELLSESENNVPLYTFRIDAEVHNDCGVDLIDAKITLNVPGEVDIRQGKAETRAKLTTGTASSYSWTVAIKPTEADRNVDYSVSVSSALISTVISSESIFVNGKNKDDNRLDFSEDTWSFQNYTVKPIPINQTDYDALLLDLGNTERQIIKNKISGGAGGQCYGMAITSILAKSNRMDLNRLQSGAANLHAVPKNDEAKSIIAYYYLTQFLSPAKDQITNYVGMDHQTKLNELVQLANQVEEGGTPVLLCFYLDRGGHAVVAYGCETARATYNGKTYNNRVLLYDNNFPNDVLYLYYNDRGQWDMLYQKKGKFVQPYNTTTLGLITSSMELIDISNADKNRESVYSYITSRDNFNLELNANGTVWTVNGTTTSDAENVIAYYDLEATGSSDLNIAIKKDATEVPYVIKSRDSEQPLDISVSYDNFYIAAETEGSTPVRVDPAGSVDIVGDTDEYRLSIAANEGVGPAGWPTVTVDGKKGNMPKLELTEQGYVLSGNNLGRVTVYGEDGNNANKLTVSVKDQPVLLADDAGKLSAKSDRDGDGTYETVLETGKAIDPTEIRREGSNFPWGTVLMIAGSVLALAAVAVAIILIFRSRGGPGKKPRNQPGNYPGNRPGNGPGIQW